jgi:hypothetical protein
MSYDSKYETDEPVLAGIERKEPSQQNYIVQLGYGFVHFFQSIYLGTIIVLTHRRFICTYCA